MKRSIRSAFAGLGIAVCLPAAVAFANDSISTLTISGPASSSGNLYVRVTDRQAGVLMSVPGGVAVLAGQSATVVRDAVVAGLGPGTLPPGVTLAVAAYGVSGIRLNYSPGTAIRIFVSSDNVSFSEINVSADVGLLLGLAFSGGSMAARVVVSPSQSNFSTPAMDRAGLAVLTVLLGLGGIILLQRQRS